MERMGRVITELLTNYVSIVETLRDVVGREWAYMISDSAALIHNLSFHVPDTLQAKYHSGSSAKVARFGGSPSSFRQGFTVS